MARRRNPAEAFAANVAKANTRVGKAQAANTAAGARQIKGPRGKGPKALGARNMAQARENAKAQRKMMGGARGH